MAAAPFFIEVMGRIMKYHDIFYSCYYGVEVELASKGFDSLLMRKNTMSSVLFILIAFFIGGCTINNNGFETDTLLVVGIFQNCISEGRYLKRSEMNEINKYLTKYEKVKSPKKEVLAELSSDFKLSYTYLKESNSEEVNLYFQKMNERLGEVLQ